MKKWLQITVHQWHLWKKTPLRCPSFLLTALEQVNVCSVPGKDGVTCSMLRNLDNQTRDYDLLETLNSIWACGQLPESFKLAVVTPIPKPGKVPTEPSNLQPIP